jgi:hypothetical protein
MEHTVRRSDLAQRNPFLHAIQHIDFADVCTLDCNHDLFVAQVFAHESWRCPLAGNHLLFGPCSQAGSTLFSTMLQVAILTRWPLQN